MNPRQLRKTCTLEAIASLDNLFHAAWKAHRGKARRPDVEDWWLHRAQHLGRLRLKLAEPKSRLLATREGVPFCGFRFLPGRQSRVLGATKRRFERRRYALFARQDLARLSESVFVWYQFSREGNAAGLRRAYVRWPLAARLKRRQRRTSRVVRGGSWINNPENLRSAYRNNNTPDNRDNNLGFRCVWVAGFSPKAARFGVTPGGHCLPGRCQESSLTAVPVPVG